MTLTEVFSGGIAVVFALKLRIAFLLELSNGTSMTADSKLARETTSPSTSAQYRPSLSVSEPTKTQVFGKAALTAVSAGASQVDGSAWRSFPFLSFHRSVNFKAAPRGGMGRGWSPADHSAGLPGVRPSARRAAWRCAAAASVWSMLSCSLLPALQISSSSVPSRRQTFASRTISRRSRSTRMCLNLRILPWWLPAPSRRDDGPVVADRPWPPGWEAAGATSSSAISVRPIIACLLNCHGRSEAQECSKVAA